MARPKKVREPKPEDVQPEPAPAAPVPRVEVIRPDPYTEIRKVVE